MLNRSIFAGAILSAALLGASAPAHAQSYSLDIEILRPTFSAGSVPGVDSPLIDAKGTTRIGFFYQFERDPLILYEFGEYMGGIVSNRHSMHLGVAYDFNKRLSGRLVIPTAFNQGTDVTALSAPGFGAGNPSVGLRGVLTGTSDTFASRPSEVALPTTRAGSSLSASSSIPQSRISCECINPDTALAISQEFCRCSEEEELDSLFFGVMNLFHPGRHLLPGAAIDDLHPIRTKTHGRPCRIHGHIASTKNDHVLAQCNGGVVFRKEIGLHEIGPGEILVG